MKYFYDTEFLEGFEKPLFGKKHHFIDLISIAMVSEDGREYYAINKECDLKRIWNNPDPWVKQNVLAPLHEELCKKQSTYAKTYFFDLFEPFTLRSMKNLFHWHGKTKQQITGDLAFFVHGPLIEKYDEGRDFLDVLVRQVFDSGLEKPHEFYGYYPAYDHVLLATLWGRMIDLPPGFPMITKCIQQMIEENGINKEYMLKQVPQGGIHSALMDARWIKAAYEYLRDGKVVA